MNCLESYAIGYPQICHPMAMEKEKIKKKYLFLMKCFIKKYCPNNQGVSYRFKALSKLLFVDTDELYISSQYKNLDDIIKRNRTIMKPRMKSFHFISYSSLFLFDSIFVMAIDNEKLGSEICKGLEEIVHQRYCKTLELVKSKMYNEENDFGDKKTITEEMVKAWNGARFYIQSQNRDITFTATMSAGKSTLINAIIGKKLSDAKKAACTETVIRFLANPLKGTLTNVISNGEIIEMQNEEDVKTYIKGRESPCEVSCYFFSILSRKKITLTDTPGVDFSRNPIHKKVTQNQLTADYMDILVHIIPVENYGSQDDFEHLLFIKQRVHYRDILFVVNMMDLCSLEDDSVTEIVAEIGEYLKSAGFENPTICPISSKAGLVLKRALFGFALSENDRKAYQAYVKIFQSKELALEKFYPKVEREETVDDETEAWIAYKNTGLPGFETLLYMVTEDGGTSDDSCG